MKKHIVVGIAGFLGAMSLAFVAQRDNKQVGFTTVHLFNMPQTEEAKLLSVFQEFNQLFSRLGYPEVKYRLWRITEDTTAQRSYRWDSVWPNRAVYEKVHQDESYKKLGEKHGPYFEEILKDHVYYRFVELVPTAKGK